jgi:sterol 3beta-glucosyltransferase
MRKELGQPPADGLLLRQVGRRQLPALMADDDLLHPRPTDGGAHAVVTGGWDMPAELRARVGEAAPDASLEAFLAAGPPPVFLGFGSMPVLNGAEMLGTVKRAVEASGQRAILAAGWSQLETVSDERLHVVGTVDHDALLPRCSAAIHHGGAGTTRASLKAGLPTWICAVFADQPFWGARCKALGVGGTFPFPKLEAGRLTDAMRQLADPTVKLNAARLGEKLRAVDGLARAVETIETAQVAVI